ncbi:MAG: chromate transporter [Rhodospirillales bacterium]|nr:chromate transporter [Rhodospirillales bacterium]MDE2576354.1 chromate transporter [Rhodospirillales bacterium]
MSDAPSTPAPTPSIGALFMGFFSVGIIGFGGVLPMARRMIVEERRWMTAGEFTDLLSLCQFLPGGNVINLAAAIGLRFRGVAGGCAGLAGLMAAPVGIVILLGAVYGRFQNIPTVRHLFAGLGAAAAGLILALSIKIAWPMRRNYGGVAIAAICYVAIAALRVPLLPTMAALVPASLVVAWWQQR